MSTTQAGSTIRGISSALQFDFMKKTVKNTMVFIALAVMLAGCESEEKARHRRDQAYASCVDSYQSKCKRACETDPKSLYCATKYGSSVVGSGCSSHMNSLSNTERIEKCQSEVCSVDSSVVEACLKRSR